MTTIQPGARLIKGSEIHDLPQSKGGIGYVLTGSDYYHISGDVDLKGMTLSVVGKGLTIDGGFKNPGPSVRLETTEMEALSKPKAGASEVTAETLAAIWRQSADAENPAAGLHIYGDVHLYSSSKSASDAAKITKATSISAPRIHITRNVYVDNTTIPHGGQADISTSLLRSLGGDTHIGGNFTGQAQGGAPSTKEMSYPMSEAAWLGQRLDTVQAVGGGNVRIGGKVHNVSLIADRGKVTVTGAESGHVVVITGKDEEKEEKIVSSPAEAKADNAPAKPGSRSPTVVSRSNR